MKKGIVFILFFFLASSSNAEEIYLKKGTWSFEYQTGVMFSPTVVHTDLPDFDFWQTNLRICRVLTDLLKQKGILRGNIEGIMEFTSSSIIKGEGSFIFGLGPIIRYNFLRPRWKIVPYFQFGGGVCYTDAYYYEGIGQGFNFTLQLGTGFRYFIGKRYSIDFEIRYNHISNAGMDHRNDGVNAIGATVGLSYFF